MPWRRSCWRPPAWPPATAMTSASRPTSSAATSTSRQRSSNDQDGEDDPNAAHQPTRPDQREHSGHATTTPSDEPPRHTQRSRYWTRPRRPEEVSGHAWPDQKTPSTTAPRSQTRPRRHHVTPKQKQEDEP